MAVRAPKPAVDERRDTKRRASVRLLVIEARYYEEIGAALAEGAVMEMTAQGVAHDVVRVPGALEIPQPDLWRPV